MWQEDKSPVISFPNTHSRSFNAYLLGDSPDFSRHSVRLNRLFPVIWRPTGIYADDGSLQAWSLHIYANIDGKRLLGSLATAFILSPYHTLHGSIAAISAASLLFVLFTAINKLYISHVWVFLTCTLE